MGSWTESADIYRPENLKYGFIQTYVLFPWEEAREEEYGLPHNRSKVLSLSHI